MYFSSNFCLFYFRPETDPLLFPFFADGQLSGKGEDAGEGRAGDGLGNQIISERFASKLFATKLFRNALLLLRFESTDLTHCFSL